MDAAQLTQCAEALSDGQVEICLLNAVCGNRASVFTAVTRIDHQNVIVCGLSRDGVDLVQFVV